MEFEEQYIKGVFVITPKRFGDARGYFSEVWKQEEFEKHIPGVKFVQDNESMSSYGVLRGLHFQEGEFAQAKLVRVSRGAVLDVIVDLRGDSPTFGKYVAVELSAENGKQLFVPRGFAHGFVVLSDVAQFQYKVDNFYAPQAEKTLRFDDETVAINWPLKKEELLLSDKDLKGIELKYVKPF